MGNGYVMPRSKTGFSESKLYSVDTVGMSCEDLKLVFLNLNYTVCMGILCQDLKAVIQSSNLYIMPRSVFYEFKSITLRLSAS